MTKRKNDSIVSAYKRLRSAATPEWRRREIAKPFAEKLAVYATWARLVPSRTVDRSEVQAIVRLAAKFAKPPPQEESQL